ncbi:MAG: CCA tRNA nucleotidyltransferase [Nanoarchaeota archaeon]
MNKEKILRKIVPSERERSNADAVIKKFLVAFSKNLKNANAVVGGSFAKDTWLKGNYDIDIFVLFKNEKDIPKLKNVLKKISKKFEVVHGSRDYYQIKEKKFILEIVPVLKISKASEAKNIMDISPLHIKWIRKNIGNLANDIRLSKAFCIAQNVYGAESYIRGFSGYVLELLTIYYKGLENLVRAAAKWKPKTIIDIKNYGSYDKLNISKISPLIVIDPVQKGRNAAAALSIEKFNEFVNACVAYLKSPSEQFFVKKKTKIPKHAIILKVSLLKGKEDIAKAKALSAFNYIKRALNEEGFLVKVSGIEFNKEILIWYKVKKKLSKYKIHYGPPIKKKENLESFKKKWNKHKFYKRNKRICIKLERKFTNVNNFIRELIKDKLLKEKIKKIEAKSL